MPSRRDEADNLIGGDPHEVWYRYGGRQQGYVGNNGAMDVAFVTSVAHKQSPPGQSSFADFDLAYDAINAYEQGGRGGVYTVQSGDTLTGIASALWGDASLWWKLAEVNGLTAESTLVEGQLLIIPVGVQTNANNASTFQPYDPLEVLGNLSPTAPKPAKGKNCGGFGQILLAVIAIVVTIATKGMAAKFFAGIMGGGVAPTVVGFAAAGAMGSVASQAVGVATGIQDKFSWNAVAMAALGGGVGASGVGDAAANAMGITSKFGVIAASAMVSSAITQGISAATGLQKEFSWAGVAAAGVGAVAGARVGMRLPTNMASEAATFITSSAYGLANAATRSLIDGSDFGDNMLAAIPDIIAQTVGASIGERAASRGARTANTGSDAVCGEGWIAALDDFVSGPAKELGTKTMPGDLPVVDEGEDIVVFGRRRSLLDRIGGALADTFGLDGQFLYDGYSYDRRFSLEGLGRAFGGASSFYLEYNPWSPAFNMRGDAARTYSTFGQAIDDIPAATGRAFNNALSAPLVSNEQLAYWGGGIREPRLTPTFGEFVGPVLGEMTGVPAMSRARDDFQAVERLSAIGDRAGAISHAQAFLFEGGNAALTYTGYGAGYRAIAAENAAARAARIDAYVSTLNRTDTPSRTLADRFEIEQTGPFNYDVSGDGYTVRIDGYRGSTMLDAKFIDDPARSPFVAGSSVDDSVREMIRRKQSFEIARYGMVARANSVPFDRLVILTNEPRAVPYFEMLMEQHAVSGSVKVVQTRVR